MIAASMLVLSRTYQSTARELSRTFRVITVELPGSGNASRLSKPWRIEQYAEWLGKLLEFLRLDRPILIGHSNSGGVALSLAANRPDRIAGLVLVDSIGADQSHSILRVLAARAMDAVLELKLTATASHHVVFNLLRHTRNFLHQVKVAARADLSASAARVAMPTLLAWGWWDLTMPVRCARLMHAQIPQAALYISSTGSHDWLVTNPREFARALTEWLSGRSLISSATGQIR